MEDALTVLAWTGAILLVFWLLMSVAVGIWALVQIIRERKRK